MKIAIIAGLLALLPYAAGQAQPQAIDGRAAAGLALFPLFMTGDVTAEFLTPALDPRIVLWFDTPVFKEGTRARMDGNTARSACVWVAINSFDDSLAKTTHVLLVDKMPWPGCAGHARVLLL